MSIEEVTELEGISVCFGYNTFELDCNIDIGDLSI